MTTQNDSPADRIDKATSARLARLGSMPVDTTRLDRAIGEHIRRPADVRRSLWLKPMRAIAAILLVGGVIAIALLMISGRPVLASPAQMALVHQEMVAGRVSVMKVESIAEANRMLTQSTSDSPTIPLAPQSHVMACCMTNIKHKKVACVLLKNDGVPITMTVASASDMRLPSSPTVTRGQTTYHVQSSGSVNMVMTQRNARWVCLIGELPAEQLMDVADKLQF